MNTVKNIIFSSYEYIKTLLKWVFIAVLIGIIGGAVGSAFHKSIDCVTQLRSDRPWLILLLPVGAVIITASYRLFKSHGRIDTNRVIEAVDNGESVPLVMAPLIFLGTVITHLLGGSAGREGAALQLGGSIGYNVGKLFRLNEYDMHIIVMSGMSGVFAALFGTPLTAAFFAIEVINVGILHLAALVPCVISATAAYCIATFMGIAPVHFSIAHIEATPAIFAKAALLSALCALVSILFCTAIKKTGSYMKKLMPNAYIRAAVGGVIIVVLTLILGTQDYNGAGMDVIKRAIDGVSARPEAFILKILFTAVTIGAGCKGGEIVPAFFVGSTFGYVVGSLLGLDTSFAAAIGFVALFCGTVNCPVASIFLALEVFGSDNILIFAMVCAICYLLSGSFGLYGSQKIMYSKIDGHYINENTK